jgi:anti-anti-sigma regulatory factor
MFQVNVNTEKNRLYVTLAGHLSAEERMGAAKAFMAAIGELQPGFDIINDMSGLHPTDAEGLKILVRTQAAARIKGVRSVIRVIRIPLSHLQLKRISLETDWEFKTATSLEEADALLDALGVVPAPEAP